MFCATCKINRHGSTFEAKIKNQNLSSSAKFSSLCKICLATMLWFYLVPNLHRELFLGEKMNIFLVVVLSSCNLPQVLPIVFFPSVLIHFRYYEVGICISKMIDYIKNSHVTFCIHNSPISNHDLLIPTSNYTVALLYLYHLF